MSVKVLDRQGRWRNKIVAFRVSPEEDEQLEAAVRCLMHNKNTQNCRGASSKLQREFPQ